MSAFHLSGMRHVHRETTPITSARTRTLVPEFMRARKAVANHIVPHKISSMRRLMELTELL